MKIVLMVEDNDRLRESFKESCQAIHGNKVLIIEASSLAEAYEVFDREVDDLDAIIMDGCVDTRSDDADTIPLLRYIREKGFTGPIIANSSATKNLTSMTAAGADHACSKMHTFDKLFEVMPV